MGQVVIRTDYDQLIKRIKPFVSSRYVDTLASPDNSNDVYIAFLPEIKFFECLAHTGGVLLHFKISQVKVAFQQVAGEPLVDGSVSFVLQFTCRQVCEEMAFHQDRLLLQPLREDNQGYDGGCDGEPYSDSSVQQACDRQHDEPYT